MSFTINNFVVCLEGYIKYLSAVNKHIEWLTKNDTDHNSELDVIETYEFSLSIMSSFLAEGLVYFDISIMSNAWFILLQVNQSSICINFFKFYLLL